VPQAVTSRYGRIQDFSISWLPVCLTYWIINTPNYWIISVLTEILISLHFLRLRGLNYLACSNSVLTFGAMNTFCTSVGLLGWENCVCARLPPTLFNTDTEERLLYIRAPTAIRTQVLPNLDRGRHLLAYIYIYTDIIIYVRKFECHANRI
jgi:hypothetical protein